MKGAKFNLFQVTLPDGKKVCKRFRKGKGPIACVVATRIDNGEYHIVRWTRIEGKAEGDCGYVQKTFIDKNEAFKSVEIVTKIKCKGPIGGKDKFEGAEDRSWYRDYRRKAKAAKEVGEEIETIKAKILSLRIRKAELERKNKRLKGQLKRYQGVRL